MGGNPGQKSDGNSGPMEGESVILGKYLSFVDAS